MILDLDAESSRRQFMSLVEGADVLIDARPVGYLAERGFSDAQLKSCNPRLLHLQISPFGNNGPWATFKGSDLVHLALGGVMMNCGYDSDPEGRYDTPPIAPQMWQSYQIAGEMAVMALLGGLHCRSMTGRGQRLTTTVHGAVAQQTETDVPNWVYLRQPHARKTGRHSMPSASPPVQAATKDGRWLYPYRSYVLRAGDVAGHQRLVKVLSKYGMEDDLADSSYEDPDFLSRSSTVLHIGDVIARFVNRFLFERDVWREFQDVGLTWAPVRRPEENLSDEHWHHRETFVGVEHPELKKSFTEIGAKWSCPEVPWRTGPRAPLLGEHTKEVFEEQVTVRPLRIEPLPAVSSPKTGQNKPSVLLDGIRYLDLGWMLASAGAGRFLAAMGAEVIKVEHKFALGWHALCELQCTKRRKS